MALRKRHLVGLLATVPTAAVISTLSAMPAEAAVCYWTSFGTSSNCDGRNPDALGTSCGSDARTVHSVVLRDPGGFAGPTVDLRYSGNCRTAWARIRGGWGPDYDQFGCFVRIHRNSDGQEYSAGLPFGSTNASAWTNVVYDANVSSYAYGNCDTGVGRQFTGRTPNW
jgi:hypothetical protein